MRIPFTRFHFVLLASVAASLPLRAARNSDRANWMHEARFGVRTHYLHDGIMRGQRERMTPENGNTLIDRFDVEALGEQLKLIEFVAQLKAIGEAIGRTLSRK